MKAGLYFSERNVVVSEIYKPKLSDGEALIRVSYAGIGGTDMMIYPGKHPTGRKNLWLWGMNLATMLKSSAGNLHFLLVDSVVIEPTLSCRHCEACAAG
ncbi:threonine dehydrogenase-like Zn-dependent dehydrogenase [Geomicrobium halophilum]|uniref:Threonine dehydrogenase-like Zn-dependent dehydrogenase n=1 Tax=Geomicrobium halophilum TaxID=549000 RepID=A0A841Q062_9BACL|nr:alcohol dehydrogenase catalytic domain-containing protein [Geomicrobium halophilum]MBB6448648.1 threonine dehydrogenase-like Zn-dependent dehydrogenase [Geomicrobium halophilum]